MCIGPMSTIYIHRLQASTTAENDPIMFVLLVQYFHVMASKKNPTLQKTGFFFIVILAKNIYFFTSTDSFSKKIYFFVKTGKKIPFFSSVFSKKKF